TAPYTRKAPYHYGWDWGPRFVTSGIWRPVSLEAWDGARINDLHIKQRQLSSNEAKLNAEVEVIAAADVNATVIITSSVKSLVTRQTVDLHRGPNLISLDFVVPNPRLWWPNGLGDHYLYNFKARLLISGAQIDEATTRTGLRSLQLRQE